MPSELGLTRYDVAADGLPEEESVQEGRVLICDGDVLIRAMPVRTYPVRDGAPVVWRTSAGDYVFHVHQWFETEDALLASESLQAALDG
jgi:hypothetical protein